MKKLFIVCIALIAASSTLRAEGFNITAGYTWFLEKENLADKVKRNTDYNGFYVGVGYTLKDVIADCISITPGIQYTMNFGKQNQRLELFKYYPELKPLDPGEGQEVDSYIQIPIRFSYGLETEHARFSFFAGPKFSVGTKAEFRGELTKLNWYADKYYNRFNLFLGLGAAAYVGEHFRINVGYDWGCINRYKQGFLKELGLDSDKNSLFESMLSVGVGLCF